MKNVLFIAPTGREYRLLPPIADKLGINLIWDDFAGAYFDDFLERGVSKQGTLDIVELIEQTIENYRHADLAGVATAVGYPGMSALAIIADRLGLPGPTPAAVMQCEHKYYGRLAHQKFAPHATPLFQLVDPSHPSSIRSHLGYPLFLKPVKSCTSMHAYRVDNEEELRVRAQQAIMPERFTKPFDDMARTYSHLRLRSDYLIAEELLKGFQVSLEGFVFAGQPIVMGILDGEMIEGTLSFNRWRYPSRLPHSVQQRMQEIAVQFFDRLGYDNAMFNMELIWDPETDRITIIEVNPKIASQFPDLIEKVDGVSSYQTLLQIAVGETPSFRSGGGEFKIAASCVLRSFKDQRVVRVPDTTELAAVNERFPDARMFVLATAGKNLSELTQDTFSYRYGLINIGAQSEDEMHWKLETIKRMLTFEFTEPDQLAIPVPPPTVLAGR